MPAADIQQRNLNGFGFEISFPNAAAVLSEQYGAGALAEAPQSVAVGAGAHVLGISTGGVAIGRLAVASDFGGVAVGQSADAATNGVAVGRLARSEGGGAVAIGQSSLVSGGGAVAIGQAATVIGFVASIAIGISAAATAANQCVIGNTLAPIKQLVARGTTLNTIDAIDTPAADDTGLSCVLNNGALVQRTIRAGAANSGPGGVGRALYVDN